MKQDDLLELPVIEVPVQCGMVRKAAILEVTNATSYEFKLTIKMMSERDAELAAVYQQYKLSWSLPQVIALRVIRHLNPGYKVKVVMG